MQKKIYNHSLAILILVGTLYSLGLFWTAADVASGALLYATVTPLCIFCCCGVHIQKLYQKSHTDHLTGLNTRAEYETLIENCSRDELTSLLMIDIDNFKGINDKYGHHVGDNALKALASVISRHVRENDSVIRWGGDEFVVILPDTLEEEAAGIADRIRHAVKSDAIHFITVSIGIADTTGRSMEETLIATDKALYRAKLIKNAVALFTDQREMDPKTA